MPRDKELIEVKAQFESLRAADKRYNFITNHMHRSKGYIQDFVAKR